MARARTCLATANNEGAGMAESPTPLSFKNGRVYRCLGVNGRQIHDISQPTQSFKQKHRYTLLLHKISTIYTHLTVSVSNVRESRSSIRWNRILGSIISNPTCYLTSMHIALTDTSTLRIRHHDKNNELGKELWTAAVILMAMLRSQPKMVQGKRVLEIGAGLGAVV
jgi:hypothetical protein